MNIPYINEAFNSRIDYAKLIEMQAKAAEENEKRYNDTKNVKTYVKAKNYEKKMHRGGKK